MELITKEIEATLPPLYSQENVPDPLAVIKLFDPCGRCTFYILEGSRQPDGVLLLFGFCRSALGPDCDELGYASLQELESVRRPLLQTDAALKALDRLGHGQKEVIEMQELPAPTCTQCGLRLEDVGGVRIVATAGGLRVRSARDAEGYLRWFCQKERWGQS